MKTFRAALPQPDRSPEERGAVPLSLLDTRLGNEETPWHRHSWPWLLMIAPALSIVGGVAMLWLALASNDGLVADDYYKQGLAINHTLARERAAAALRLRAHVVFSPDFARVRVALPAPYGSSTLALRLVHPTRIGLDRIVTLISVGEGTYEGALNMPAIGRWNVFLEDSARTWRLWGAFSIPGSSAVTLESR